MKYSTYTATNFFEFTQTMTDAGIGEVFALGDINSLLLHLSSKPSQVNRGTLETFFAKSGVIVLVTHEEEVVGIAILVSVFKLNGATGRIEQVVISPKHRGKALSRKLMYELIRIAQARDLRYIDLTSDPSRTIANLLYQKLGFGKSATNPYRLRLPT